MLPIIEVPETIALGMKNYRNVFCREEGFDYVSRYVTGLIISPNKTLQCDTSRNICSSGLGRRQTKPESDAWFSV